MNVHGANSFWHKGLGGITGLRMHFLFVGLSYLHFSLCVNSSVDFRCCKCEGNVQVQSGTYKGFIVYVA